MKQPYGKNNWVICGSYTSCLKTLSALLKKKILLTTQMHFFRCLKAAYKETHCSLS